MVHLGYLISLTHLCFIASLLMYIVLIDALIYSAAQLRGCLINVLTFLLIYRLRDWSLSDSKEK